MRNVCSTVLNAGDDASRNGSQIPANQLVSASFHAVFGDATAAGTLKIQASNDIPPAGNLMSFTVTNWVDVPSATASVASGAAVLITIAQTAYQWMRVVYTRSGGGSTTVVVNMNALSV